MRTGLISCPRCGCDNLRASQTIGFWNRVRSFVGILPFRCKQCDHRFEAAIWKPSLFRYARCPKCLRMELTTWSQQYYNPPKTTLLLLRLGATPYRCDFCRCNFASFRACKERYSWRRARQAQTGSR